MKLYLRNNDSIRVGELIDMDACIRREDMCGLVSYLYRDDEGRLYDVGEIPFKNVFYAYKEYMEWRTKVFEIVSFLFQKKEDDNSKRIYDKLGLKLEDDVHDKEDEEWARRYGWYEILFKNICNGDFFNMHQAYNLRVIECFNHLVYLHSHKGQ